MSEVTRRELFPGVWLRTVHTRKFKSAFLSLTLMVPLDRERAAENALVPYVLRRGTREHPDLESLSAALISESESRGFAILAELIFRISFFNKLHRHTV